MLLSLLLAAASAAEPVADEPASEDSVIIVTGERPPTVYTAEASAAAGFAEVPLAEVPQSIQVVTRDLIDDQVALSLAELLGNVASASNALSRSTPFATGFAQLRGQDASLYRDGLRDVDFADIDTSALNGVERLEVLKGPAGLVYGTGGPGGIINIVTKRPLDSFRGSFTTTVGTRGTAIFAGDVSVPLGGGLAVRATGEIERSDGFIDFSEIERDNYAIALGFDDGGPFRALARFEDIQSRDDNAMTLVGLPSLGTVTPVDGLRLRRSLYLGEPNADFLRATGSMASLFLDYDLSDAVGLELAGRRTRVNFEQTNLATLGVLNPVTGLLPRGRFRTLDLRSEQYNARALLRAAFATGPLSHDLTIGAEYFQHDIEIVNIEVPRARIPAIDVRNPVYLPGFPATGTEIARNRDTVDDVYELFAHDVIKVGERLTLTGAIRFTRNEFDAEEAIAAAPGLRARAARPGSTLEKTVYQLGATYKAIEGLSLFAGFNSGFDANDELGRSQSRTGEPFVPETFEQIEAGVKFDALAGLTGTLAVFELERRNILSPDPVDDDFLIQAGTERTRGFEADLAWTPIPAVTVRGGYAYLDAEVTESTDPALVGKRRPGTPRHSANAYGSVRFTGGLLENLQLGAGVTYVGGAFAALTNTVRRPSYTLASLNASYAIDRYRFDVGVSNLFDERYFITRNNNSVTPGEPRLVTLRGTVRF